MRLITHTALIIVLTLLTQIGGVIYVLALLLRRKWRVPLLPFFLALYAIAWPGIAAMADISGRKPLPCTGDGLRMQSLMYCALHRHYVSPVMENSLETLAQDMEGAFPGTPTLVLDAGFPFLDGFPLLPHLSHDDGDKADLAFWYRDETGYLPSFTRSPIGYWAFEALRDPDTCPDQWPSLRWNFRPLQSWLSEAELDGPRLAFALTRLAQDPAIGKILIEPELAQIHAPKAPKSAFKGAAPPAMMIIFIFSCDLVLTEP